MPKVTRAEIQYELDLARQCDPVELRRDVAAREINCLPRNGDSFELEGTFYHFEVTERRPNCESLFNGDCIVMVEEERGEEEEEGGEISTQEHLNWDNYLQHTRRAEIYWQIAEGLFFNNDNYAPVIDGNPVTLVGALVQMCTEMWNAAVTLIEQVREIA